jgi:hypothetical protein
MLRAAIACTAISAMTFGYRPLSVMFAIVGMSFAVAYLLHRDKLRE